MHYGMHTNAKDYTNKRAMMALNRSPFTRIGPVT